jgi:hypothetical protein
MSVVLYADVHIPRAITSGLRRLGVDILTAQEDNAATLSDIELLDRATALGRALFTFDDDLLEEAHTRQAAGVEFAGVIFAHPLKVTIGECVNGLQLIAEAADPEDVRNLVIYLPFR